MNTTSTSKRYILKDVARESGYSEGRLAQLLEAAKIPDGRTKEGRVKYWTEDQFVEVLAAVETHWKLKHPPKAEPQEQPVEEPALEPQEAPVEATQDDLARQILAELKQMQETLKGLVDAKVVLA